jgi:hypothetical protein
MTPRWLYLHGFASGPESTKGRSVAGHFANLGIQVERLNLRVPSMEHLRLSAMIDTAQKAIGGERDRAVIFGSSLGGLTAARLAEKDPRVAALVLLAPAFRFSERWPKRLGKDFERWRETGWIDVEDHATRGTSRVDFGFFEDATRIDVGWPDVRVPVLIVHGVHDDVVTVEVSREWAKGKRHVQLVEVNDGHELTASLRLIQSRAEAFLAGFLGSAASKA